MMTFGSRRRVLPLVGLTASQAFGAHRIRTSSAARTLFPIALPLPVLANPSKTPYGQWQLFENGLNHRVMRKIPHRYVAGL
ncbi:hypothetical protein [Mycobacterium lehmannii]|uniref:hypothetical protein n=1 Tax=Mycobacterium lehmannii TaxID=2048550 RepID=UPI0011551F3E|nr:hypothetical protein [Mycobacterium lehmannii]